MNKRIVLVWGAIGFPWFTPEAQVREPAPTLQAFRTDREITGFLNELARKLERRMALRVEDAPPPPDCGAIDVVGRSRTLDAIGVRSALVHGEVVDPSGNPLEDVIVSIDSLAVRAETQGDGSFELVVPRDRITRRGQWTLAARRLGYGRRVRLVMIHPGDSIQVAVTMCNHPVALQEMVVTGAASLGTTAASVTNTQHAGVDEGGIVKAHGDHLVILRRGQLFTVRLGNELRPVSVVDAYAPGSDPRGVWYDEMLIAGDKVIVVGYSYASRGTEIGIFSIDNAGELRHRSTYHVRSNDYYSSRNYASRLLGSKLIFYTPEYLPLDSSDPKTFLPAVRRWHKGARDSEFRRIVSSAHVFRPAVELDPFDVALHSVIVCDLAKDELQCDANSVFGPSGRVFYVSPTAVYTWLSAWRSAGGDRASPILYRLPLDGSPPTAVEVAGSPVDQFSFLESDDGHLNVLVRESAHGDAMWQAERTSGDVALLRFPLTAFGDGSRSISPFRYRQIPRPVGVVVVNRFVGDHLLYGTGNRWGRPSKKESVLYVVPFREGEVTRIALPHGTDRIEVMGESAVVIGTDSSDLHFTAIGLSDAPTIALRHTIPNAAQGELRSHGFFYRSDGPGTGVLGLPIRAGGSPGYTHLWKSSAAIAFIHNLGDRFAELGTLDAQTSPLALEACVASCVDWYGNARPVFMRGRILALLGYELVEGRIEGQRMREIGRVSFSPPLVRAVRR